MDREIIRPYRRLRKYALIGLAAVIVIALGVWAFFRATTTIYRSDDKGLIISEVVEGDFNDYIRLTGKVETATSVQVSALETGIVERILVEEGSFVQAGDVILTLFNPNLQQQILDSESQLAERQNMLRDTEIALEKERLQLKQDILAGRIEANRMSRLYNQQKTLYDEKLTSREEYLKAREDYELAEEKLKLLRERIYQDSLYRSVQVGMMRESLDNMQRNFALVRQRADNLNVRASHSGQLGSLKAELGQNIPSGQQVGQINLVGDYKMAVNIDEFYIDRVEKGLEGSLQRNNVPYGVTVNKVYPEVSEGRFRADLIFKGDVPENIRVGQSYAVKLQLGDPVHAVMLPRGSFFQTTGGKWIFVVDSDGRSATRREIKIGRQNPEYYEIIDGLAPGERVISSGYATFGNADKIMLNVDK